MDRLDAFLGLNLTVEEKLSLKRIAASEDRTTAGLARKLIRAEIERRTAKATQQERVEIRS